MLITTINAKAAKAAKRICFIKQPEPVAYSAGTSQEADRMIDLYDEATNRLIGSITEADLQVLVDALEEESLDDHDYYIDAATIDMVADGKATKHLVSLLRAALGAKEGVDIRWERR